MPSAAGFRNSLQMILGSAGNDGLDHLDVQAGGLHRQVSGYPGRGHRMPVCCGVMRAEMRQGDVILAEPPKGQGASLTIRYVIPRA